MAARVTTAEVLEITQYDTTAGGVVATCILAANAMVDDQLLGSGHSETMLKYIELFLASHFSVLSIEKGPLASQTVGDATERYHDIYKAGLGATRFGQQAMLLDTTGTLAGSSASAENPQLKALFTVVGDPPPEVDEDEDL